MFNVCSAPQNKYSKTEQSFFTPLLLSLCGACFREALPGCPVWSLPERKALPVPATFTPCVVLLILLDSSAWFSLAAAPAVQTVSLPAACPLHWWLVRLLPPPVLWRGTAPCLGWRQLHPSPSLAFQSCSPPNTCFLRKILGKGLTRHQRSISAEHIRFQEPWGVKQK